MEPACPHAGQASGERELMRAWNNIFRAVLVAGLSPAAAAEEAPAPAQTWSFPAPSDTLRGFIIRGLWSREYRIEEAFARMGGGFLDEGWVWDGAGSGWLSPRG